jgi:hypothetical protein
MKRQDKKQIKQTVSIVLSKILESLKLSKPSKRTVKAISKVSKALRRDLEKVRGKQHKSTSVKPRSAKKESFSKVIKKIVSKNGTPNKSRAIK